jgi:hypothetical protein
MANEYMKCSIFLAIKEMQIKRTLRFHLTPVRWLSSRTQTANAGEDVGEKGSLHTVSGNLNYCIHYGNPMEFPLKN